MQPEIINSLLNLQLFGNNLSQIAIFAAAFIVFLVLFKLIQKLVLNKLEQLSKLTATDIDDTLVQVVRSIKPPFYSYLAFFSATNFLQLTQFTRDVLKTVLIVWSVFQVVRALQILINFSALKYLEKNDSKSAISAMTAVKLVSNIALWSVGSLLVLANLGIDVTSLVAGLGIGGIAIAMASKDLLSGLFSSFVIFFEKPFHIGDLIKVGEHQGTVTNIGLRSTHITPVQGGIIIIPNEKITSTPVENLVKKDKHRISFNLGVTYETPVSKIKKVPRLIKSIILGVGDTQFDRTKLTQLADSAIIFEVVYFTTAQNYNKRLSIQQKVFIQILETLEEENIDLAYPTQTIHLQK